MTTRAIVIYPDFSNMELINEIREKHDPLHKYIAPHITLVFPFQSTLKKDELIEHLDRNLKELTPFDLVVRGVTGASDGYVFLDVKVGNDNVIALHDRLYKGILKPFHNRFIPYTPHITVARIEDEKVHNTLVHELEDFEVEFRTVIDKLSIEVLDDCESTVLEYEYKL